MSDLVKRLRDLAEEWYEMCKNIHQPLGEAADALEAQAARIAELEAALQDMSKHVWRGDWNKLKPETRALLGEKP